MKTAGCVLLLCAFGGMAIGAVGGLKARVDQLRQFLRALEWMERELRCRLTPMPELLSGLAGENHGPVGEFFTLCARGVEHTGERPFSRLWAEALEAADLSLTQEDRGVLRELGGSLGRYDGASQCQAIEQTRSRIEDALTGALERRERLGRVYGALGLAAGAFVCILLV